MAWGLTHDQGSETSHGHCQYQDASPSEEFDDKSDSSSGLPPMERSERQGLEDDKCPIAQTTVLLGNGR